jgi:methionyl-tRNA formyltransferase
MGTPSFVMPTLKTLHKKSDLSLIVTGKSKKTGRGLSKINHPEPYLFACENNIECIQIDDIKDPYLKERLDDIKPDISMVIAFGFLLPKSIYEIPTYDTINIHASLLPKYRGASPIHQSLLSRDVETGVTFQRIVEKIDRGYILFSKSVEIYDDDDYLSLSSRLSATAGDATDEFFELLDKDMIRPRPQLEAHASYCKKIKKEDAIIDWNTDAFDIVAKIKAYTAWPVAFFEGTIGTVKIYKAYASNEKSNFPPGTVAKSDKQGFAVSCKRGIVYIEELQMQNKKRTDYISFLNGHRISVGDNV